MSTPAKTVKPVHWLEPLIFVLALISAVFTVGFPLYVVRPFRYQGPVELSLALENLHRAPWITIVDLVVIVLVGRSLWRESAQTRKASLKRSLIVASISLVALCAVVARVNLFEKMFHPISNLHFLPVAQAKLAPDDMLMAVTIGGESHAYPIREMAYHHVVNDVVGDTPVAATY